jgi:endonuclease G, mitochondrial
MRTRRWLFPVAILLLPTLAAFPVGSVRVALPPQPQTAVSLHLTLGNPSNATADESDRDNFLMVKPQYALSFNNTKGGPNWVSWHLQASDVGDEERGDFHPDDSLPATFKHIRKADYNSAGFDRGHVCNSKDRTDTRENNDATFFMTNILPQAPDNNQGPWRILEDFERSLAQDGNELYIIAGAYGSGGTGKFGSTKKIAKGKVNVPKTFWEVIVVLPEGDNDLSRITKTTRAIAVCMPNEQGIRRTDWRKFVTSIRNVEVATKYDFLSELPLAIQAPIETRIDSEGTSTCNPCH